MILERIISIISKIGFILACAIAAFIVYVFFLWVPTSMYAEAECLRNGYPKYAVSIGLERYCMNLDGSVTVKVDHMKGKP